MAIITQEGLAGIRLLVCMARADGVLRPDERFALEDTLAGLTLPGGLSIETLLTESTDSAALAHEITSSEGRDYTYASVFALAYCDRELAESEERLLNTLRTVWGIQKNEDQKLVQALDLGRNAEPPDETPSHISDDKERTAAFEKLLSRYAILTALTGAIPIPLVPDLMVVPMQISLVYKVAGLFGQTTDKNTVQLMFETLGVGTGVRIGISALSKFVPGWGSVVGATSSFATTFALGKVAYAFFESEGKKTIESLKPLFREEQQQGKQKYQEHRAALDEAQKEHADTLRQLTFDLQSGRISQQAYEKKVDAL